MANRLQDAYRNNILGDGTYTNVQLDADDIRAIFLDTADDDAIAADGDLAAILSAARVPAAASAPALASKTIGVVAVGVFDAADPTYTALTGDQVERLLMFKHTGVDATSVLIAYWDTFTSGMPLTPNGGDVLLQLNASGIFQV